MAASSLLLMSAHCQTSGLCSALFRVSTMLLHWQPAHTVTMRAPKFAGVVHWRLCWPQRARQAIYRQWWPFCSSNSGPPHSARRCRSSRSRAGGKCLGSYTTGCLDIRASSALGACIHACRAATRMQLAQLSGCRRGQAHASGNQPSAGSNVHACMSCPSCIKLLNKLGQTVRCVCIHRHSQRSRQQL